MAMELNEYNDKQVISKTWGFERVITNNELYCGKLLVMDEGFQSSKHFHKEKDETMLVIEGAGVLEIWDKGYNAPPKMVAFRVEDGNSVRIPPGVCHRFSTPMGERLVLVEFSTPHKDEDVVRLENSCTLENRK